MTEFGSLTSVVLQEWFDSHILRYSVWCPGDSLTLACISHQ